MKPIYFPFFTMLITGGCTWLGYQLWPSDVYGWFGGSLVGGIFSDLFRRRFSR